MNFLIVSATPKDNFDKTEIGDSIGHLNGLKYPPHMFASSIFYKNKLGLPKVYNISVNESLKTNENNSHTETDAFIFVHHDVYIDDLRVFDKLATAFEEFDVVGIAGSRKVSMKQPVIAWHCSEREFWSGGCAHPQKDENGNTKIYYNSFGLFNQRVLTLDGVFLAVKRKVFENGIRFDENFDFDFYDMAFCLNCHKAGYKLGTAPIFCIHQSHGSGIHKLSYLHAQQKFVELYGKTVDK